MRPYATGVWGLTLLLQAKGVLGASISYSLPRAQRPEVDKEQVDKPGVGTYTLRKDLAADEVCSRVSIALLQLLQQRYAAGLIAATAAAAVEVCSRYAIWWLLQPLPTTV